MEVLVLSLNEDKVAVGLAEKLRGKGVRTMLMMDKAVGKGLEYANGKGVGKVVFVGRDEVAKGKFKVRDMVSGDEKDLSERDVLGLVGAGE